MLEVLLKHRTHYSYSAPVSLGLHRLYLYPRADNRVRILDYSCNLTPDATVNWGRDAWDNTFGRIRFSNTQTSSLSILIQARIGVVEENPFDFILEPDAARYPVRYRAEEKSSLSTYSGLHTDPAASKVLNWIYDAFPGIPQETMELLVELNRAIFQRFQYVAREEEGVQTPNQTLELGSGSCRDFAWLYIHACRQMGFAARFVSGYVYTPADGKGGFEDRAAGTTHAWAEVYLPGIGWKGFDPTNGILTTSHFIPCAVGPDPDPISPIQGSFASHGNIATSMEVEVVFSEPGG